MIGQFVYGLLKPLRVSVPFVAVAILLSSCSVLDFSDFELQDSVFVSSSKKISLALNYEEGVWYREEAKEEVLISYTSGWDLTEVEELERNEADNFLKTFHLLPINTSPIVTEPIDVRVTVEFGPGMLGRIAPQQAVNHLLNVYDIEGKKIGQFTLRSNDLMDLAVVLDGVIYSVTDASETHQEELDAGDRLMSVRSRGEDVARILLTKGDQKSASTVIYLRKSYRDRETTLIEMVAYLKLLLDTYDSYQKNPAGL